MSVGCRGCGRENRADSRFCDACGSALAVRCQACDRELNADARFCDGCGTSVAAPGGATPPNAAPSTDSEAVRKTVTVLFCDLVGSTAFAESVDTESAREAMSRYHSMAKSMIEANGGTVAKFIGDGVMALFGVPEVAEDDAERAVAAGAGLQRGFVPVRDHIAKRYGVEVDLRVGINTGEVVIDDADADLVGDVLNTAARLEAACVPGQVLVGEETWRLTRSAVGYEPLGEVTVKGKRDGLATYQLVLADDGTGFAVRGGGHPDSTPFIGRDDELGRLRALFEETLAVSEARLATVIGSPGVGKTRLARELGNTASAEADVVEVRCERAGTATFAPVVDLLQQVAGLDDGDTPDQIVAALRDLVGGEPDADRVVELLGGFVGTANPRSTEDAFFGVRRLVEILGGHRPLVLVIDDIQWAEPLFLDLLEHLAEWSKVAPVLIVGLARPELREIRPALTETGRRVALIVSLEGLDAAATELLAAELLGGAALPAELTAKLPSSTDGNPLFVRELIRMLVDDGVITQRDDRWELAVDLDAVEVPPTIQSLLSTRVERLPPIERRVLEQASVIGPEFPLGALAELLPEIGRSELELVLERLRRKEQVEPTGTYWGDEPIVRFHHVLIRDAAYRRLLKGARAELHLRVGEWLDRTASGLVGEFEVAIAFHFEQAQLYRRQLGDDDDTTAEAGRRAAELLHVAATRALERDDLSATAGLSRRAIDCHGDDAESLPELLVLACESMLASGDATTGAALVKRLGDRASGDARLEAWATCFTAQLAVMTDPTGLHQAAEHTQDAAERFEALGDQAGLAKARIVRAGALARLGQVGAAETELDLALTAARAAGDRRRITAVLSSAPVAALWGPSPVARAGGRCLDVVRLSRITADSPAVVATSSRCQAVLEAMRGRFDTARSLLDASRTTSLELGLAHGLLETSLYAGIVELLAHDPAAAEPYLRHAFGGLGQLGIGADAGQAAAHLARALLLQGRLDEADDLAADSDALAGQNLQTAIAARSAQAEILAARGEADAALALADEAVRMATDTDLVFDHANALSTLARVRAAAGDADGAQRAASAARELFAQKGATVTVDVTAVASTATTSHSEPSSDASDERSSIEPWDTPWNEADRLTRQSALLLAAGDLTAWESTIGEHIRGADLRSGVRLDYESRSEYVSAMTAVSESVGTLSCDVITIASRGDNLVLSELHWTLPDDPTGPQVATLSIRGWSQGKLVTTYTFDVGDLRAAVAELDRLYLETVDPIEGGPIAMNRVLADAIPNGDLDRIMRGIHPDLTMTDHRPIGWGSDTRFDEFRERMRTLTEQVGSETLLTQRVWRRSATLSCHANRLISTTAGAGQLVSDQLIMGKYDPATGLCIRIDQFAEDQLAEAFACFDAAQAETDAVIPAPNTAELAGGVANVRARTASLDEFLAMFAEDFTATLADGTTVTPDDLRNGAVEPIALGYGGVDRRVMSVLTNRLAMLYVGFDDGTGHWSVEEVDETGRLRSVRIFEQLVDAADAIDARWAELDPAGIPGGWIESARAWRRGDIDALEQVYSEDFAYVEHRPLGFPSGDRDHYLAMCRANADIIRAAPLVITCAHATDPGGTVMRIVAVSDPGGAGEWESLVTIVVFTSRDGLITRLEGFADDDLDAAMARYHELMGTTPPADAPTEPDEKPWNEADRLFRRNTHLLTSEDLDAWEAMLDDHVSGADLRPGVRMTIENKTDLVEQMSAVRETMGPMSCGVTTIAARGDDLVLSEMNWTRQDDPTGPRLDSLVISRWSGGKQLIKIVFETDDLRAAVAELDRLHLDTLDPIDGALAAENWRFTDAVRARDVDRIMRGLHPDIVVADHKQIGWGADSKFEFFRERMRVLTDGPQDLLKLRDWRLTATQACYTFRLISGTPGDGQLVSDQIVVAQSEPATGMTIRIDQFGDDQLDEALAFLDAAQAEIDAVIPAPNTAVLAGGVANARARTASLDEFLAMFADDFTATLADGTTVILDDVRNGTVGPVKLGYGVVDRRIMSVLTDRLAMLYVGFDDGTGHWSVEEIDDNRRISSVRQFASVADAADAIEQRWSDLGVDDVSATVLRANRAVRAPDPEALAELLADEFWMQDHRPFGFPPLDREFILASMAPESGGAPADPLVVQCVYTVSPRAQVSLVANVTDSSSGHVWESLVGITVIGVSDGALTSIEYFPEDELDAAMARFHELDGTNPPADATPPFDDEPWNDADRWMRRANELRTQGHSKEFVDLLAEDIVSEDRQTLAQHIYHGRDEVLAGFQSEILPTIHAETIACRGQRLVVQHHVWRDDEADVEYEWLYLTRWSPAGQIVHAVFFDPTDLRAAFEQLDDWYIEELSPIDAARVRTATAYFDAANDRDLDRAVKTLAPDVVSTTHRAISWGQLDRDGVAAGLATITDHDGAVLFANERIELAGPSDVLLDSRLELTDRHGNVMVDRFVTVKRMLPASGLIVRMDHFEPDQAHAARELTEQFVAETNADPMVNTAVIAGGLVNALARYGEPGDVLRLLADDFTATLIDGTTVTLDDFRNGDVDAEALGYGVRQRETIAVRGERLALTRIENSRWSVEQLDDHDRLTRVNVFAHDDLLAAANALDDAARQLAENAHIPEWTWESQRAHRNYDLDVAMTALLDDDFEQIDHRPMGYAPMGKSELIALYRTGLDDPTLRAVPVYSVIHRTFDGGCLAAGMLWMRGTSDDYWNGQPFLFVLRAAQGRLVSGDLYPGDDLDAAMARFHELAGGASNGEPWNDAHRWSREVHDAPVEPVAVRGDHLMLYHVARGTGSLRLDQWSADGQLVRTVSFHADDVAMAVSELNAWYADEVGFDPVKLASFHVDELLNARNGEAFLATLDPSCEVVDHRPIGWGTSSVDGVRDRVASLVALDADYVSFEARIHRSNATVHAYTGGYRVTGAEGAVLDEQHVLVYAYDPATGLARRGEQFPLEDLDAALARADELAIEFTPVPTPNRAIVTGGSANRWARAGQTDLFLDHFADSFTATSADGSTVTRDDLVSGAVAPGDLGFGGTRRSVVGVGGERVAMLTVTGDDDSIRWSIEVIDGDGRLREIRQFPVDRIVDAIATYDQCWRDAEGASLPRSIHLVQRFNRFLNRLDPVGLDEVLADDYGLTDHRQMGLGTFDRQQFIGIFEGVTPAAEDGAEGLIIRQVHAATQRAIVAGQAYLAVSPSGEVWERLVNIATLGVRDGHVTHDDLYEEGDLDAAMARFHELDAIGADAAADDDAPEVGFDPVASFTTHIDEIQTRGDVEAFIALLHPSYRIIDHRSLGWPTLDVDGMRERTRTLADLPGEVVVRTGRVHVLEYTFGFLERGYDMTRSDGSTVEDRHLMVTVVDPATGLLLRSEQFEVDELAAATARLDELRAEFPFVPTPNRAVVTGGSANRWARAGQTDLFRDHFADGFTATMADGSAVTRVDIVTGAVAPAVLGFGGTDRRAIAAMSERLSLLYVGADDGNARWSVEEVDQTGRLIRIRQFDERSIVAAANHHDAVLLSDHRHDQPWWSEVSVAFLQAHRERNLADLDAGLHPEFELVDRRELGYSSIDRQTFIDLFALVPVGDSAIIVQEAFAGSEACVVSLSTQYTLGDTGGLWESVVALSVLEQRDGRVARLEMFHDGDLDAAMARFHELDAEARADTTWNRADRAGHELFRDIGGGRVTSTEVLADDAVVDDRRHLLYNTYVGRDAVIEGWRTTGTIRPWQVEFDTLAVRGENLALIAAHFAKVDDSDTTIESLGVIHVNADSLIDRMVSFDAEDLAAAVDELDRMYTESLDTTDLLEHRNLTVVDLHYGGLNAGDLQTGMVVYHPSSVFIDHRPLGWGTLDLDGIRTRMRTIAESPDRYFHYLRRAVRYTSTSLCEIGRNHAVTADGFVNDSDILSIFTMDPATGLGVRTEQFDPEDLDAAVARFDEIIAAELATAIPPNRAVLSGGLANLRARLPRPDRFIDGLADDFTATLPDGSAVTLDDLRAGTFTPTDIGFGVTDRELIAVRNERLAFIRVEGARWSIEQIDEHDRLVRVALFEQGDLLAATNALELMARGRPDADLVPEPIRQWLDTHRNNDVVGQTALTHDDFSIVDHRPLGYGTMDKENGLALFHVRNEDETLRGVPVYSVIHAANEQACVLAGALWTRGGAGDYWIGLPFIGVYGSADDKLRTVDLFAEDDLDGAMTHFDELSGRREPTRADRWQRELTAMVNERRLDEFEARLTEGFTDDSRRTGYSFVLDRDQFLTGVQIFVEQGLSIHNLGVVATAGDVGVLYRCEVAGDDNVSSFLQIGLLDPNGNLTRMIEFDDDRRDDALAELAHVTGEPVTLVPPATSQF